MARYKASVLSSRPRAEVFDYLSDFSTTAEWDPGVIEAERLDEAPIARGSEFRLLTEFLRRKTAIVYRIVAFDPPYEVAFRGENASVVSLDRITFEPAGAGTRLTYDAQLTLKGAAKLADPLLALVFRRVGDRALEGMRRALGASERPS